MLYLDNAATTPVRRDVIEAMWPFLTAEFGNPSSHHTVGERAASALADARRTVAEWWGVRASEVVFTSGGTEADNLAVKGIVLARRPRGAHIVSTRIEHEAVLESLHYLERFHDAQITYVDTDETGLVSPDALAAALREDTTLVSIMLANNEIGTVQDVASLARVAHGVGAAFHTDAVQAAGWLDLNVAALGVDALSVSGHKLGAPKGIGAAYVRARVGVEPVLHGGGQERGWRSGTENVAAAVGLAAAVRAAESERVAASARVTAVRDRFIAEVLRQVPGALLTGHPTRRLPTIASFCFPGTSGEAVLLELEQRGVVSSSGSACAAGSDEPSHVLTAIGIDPAIAQTAVRFSLASTTTDENMADVATALAASVATVSGLGSA
jgi:cysteine desulfurase